MTPLKNDMYDLCFSKIISFQVPWKKTWAVILHQTRCTKKHRDYCDFRWFSKTLGFCWSLQTKMYSISYWKRWISSAMLVYWRVTQLTHINLEFQKSSSDPPSNWPGGVRNPTPFVGNKRKLEGGDHHSTLTSWWLNFWKICSSNWLISPGRGENDKYLNPSPS